MDFVKSKLSEKLKNGGWSSSYSLFLDHRYIAPGGLIFNTQGRSWNVLGIQSAEDTTHRRSHLTHEDLSECAKKGIAATKWINVNSFDKIIVDDGTCTDENESCERWSAHGECTKNPVYMVGTSDLAGTCRRSCKVC